MFAVLAILAALPLAAAAQITTATIVGTISDPSGANVPNASVTARNVDTGLKRTVTSDAEGSYRLEFLSWRWCQLPVSRKRSVAALS